MKHDYFDTTLGQPSFEKINAYFASGDIIH